jgi:hypothetical protein
MKTPPKRPTPKPAVTYNQDELSDFTTNGGSVIDLFSEELTNGNTVIVIQEPFNAPRTIIAVITSIEDIERLKEANRKMSEWLAKATNSVSAAT